MLSAVLFSLLVAAPDAGPVVTAPLPNPDIQLRLNKSRGFERGDRIRAYVSSDVDGFLLVLHAEPDGRVRVLFPLDPGDDNFVRGQNEYEIRGRGDRHAFTIYESSGLGTVYAAFSRDPFMAGEFVRGDHWDYSLPDWYVEADGEAELTALVQRMAGGGQFDYDFIQYDVGYTVAYDDYGYRPSFYDPYYHGHYWDGYSGFSINIGYGWGYRRSCWSSFWCSGWDYYPYRTWGYYDRWHYSPWGYGYYAGYRPRYRGYPGTVVVVNRPRAVGARRYTFKSSNDRWGIRPEAVQPRRRALASSGGRNGVSTSRVQPSPRRATGVSNTTRRTASPTASPGRRTQVTNGSRPSASQPTRRTTTTTNTLVPRDQARPTRRTLVPQTDDVRRPARRIGDDSDRSGDGRAPHHPDHAADAVDHAQGNPIAGGRAHRAHGHPAAPDHDAPGHAPAVHVTAAHDREVDQPIDDAAGRTLAVAAPALRNAGARAVAQRLAAPDALAQRLAAPDALAQRVTTASAREKRFATEAECPDP